MNFVKKTLALLLAMVIVVGILSNVPTEAKKFSLATPKITVKTIKDSTGVKITIGKTKDADGYEVWIKGKSTNDKEYKKYVNLNGSLESADEINVTEYINESGESRRTLTIKYLPEGSYTVKVLSWNDKSGTRKYSKYCKKKSFKLKSQKSKGLNTKYDFSKVKKGDIIKFGSYEQDLDYTNGKEPIEWIVLEKTTKSILLISKYALDCVPYNIEYDNVTWETCTLRKWLNNVFLKTAFNKTEQGMINSTTLKNHSNTEFGTSGGNSTNDKVFLLSQQEMINTDYGFSDNYTTHDKNRVCTLAWDKHSACWWLLRSPGFKSDKACCVSSYGEVDSFNNGVGDINYGIRPALHLNLQS